MKEFSPTRRNKNISHELFCQPSNNKGSSVMNTNLRPLASIVILHALLFDPGVYAQEKMSLSIEKSIEIGLQNSKFLHSSGMRVQDADARAGEASSAQLPTLKLGANYTRLSD